MTKNIFITAVAVLLSVALCPLWAQNVSEDCKVGEFSAINLRSVGNIIFTQSDTYSCRMEGPFEYVDKTKVTVKGETLVIEYKQKNVKNVKNLTFYITAPDLKSVKIDGVGNFNAKETLKLKNVTFKLDGVGNCEVKKLHCDELELMVGRGREYECQCKLQYCESQSGWSRKYQIVRQGRQSFSEA